MATDKSSFLHGLLANTEKAMRRGKKLEKTLLKIVAQSEPSSGAEELLKSVQKGMKKLKNEAKEIQRTLSSNKKRPPAEEKPLSKPDVAAESPQPPVKRSRKKPVPAAETAPAPAAISV